MAPDAGDAPAREVEPPWHELWIRKLSEGVTALNQRAVKMKLRSVGQSGHISLVARLDDAEMGEGREGQRLAYVTWTNEATRFGREVRIDERQCAVYSVRLHELRSWASYEVVDLAIGIKMMKVRFGGEPNAE